MSIPIHDDIFSPAVLENPYPYYALLRKQDPVRWNTLYGMWIVTRYEDVTWLVRHPELFSSEREKRDLRPPSPPIDHGDDAHFLYIREFRGHQMVRNDPPDHLRMREAVHQHFTPRRMERWRVGIRRSVRDLLKRAAPNQGMDVLAELATPLPVNVVGELMGIPKAERATLQTHAERRLSSNVSLSPDRMRLSAEGIRLTADFLTPMIEERLRNPGEDLLSMLAVAEKEGLYSREETLANAMDLIDGGYETTIRMISNAILSLMRHQEQWGKLTRNPALADSAIEECLRYDPPLGATLRIAAGDIEVKGRRMKEGDRVLWVIASANRDPAAFINPDLFDITRAPNHHLSFGSGIHYCLGQYVARMEGQEVLRALAERFPSLRLTDRPVEYAPDRRNRALKALWLTWD